VTDGAARASVHREACDPAAAPPLLEARGISVARAGDEGPGAVLDGVDFALPAGVLVEVAGPSGAGKTTLLLALARLLPGVTGALLLDGCPAAEIPPSAWRTQVALLPQRAALVPGTLAENLRLPWTLKVRHGERPPADEVLFGALEDVGLGGLVLDRDVARLSVGQLARVALVRVMLTRPRVLLLDEPDASLDDASAAEVARVTSAFVEGGGSVVRVSHVRADARASMRYRLEAGKLSAAPAPVPPQRAAAMAAPEVPHA